MVNPLSKITAVATDCRMLLAALEIDLSDTPYPWLLGISAIVNMVAGCKRSVSRHSNVARQAAYVDIFPNPDDNCLRDEIDIGAL
ncbi:hypothetical protein CLU79DRAFT_696366 [Phycomyces nitens]|nr:hypothetical protein CLU79DRAFT_696607 [Phycomyces nitens]KAI9028972.1 hypothetical protein CLU79DRAFT_696366 [Phycomyces nitens]